MGHSRTDISNTLPHSSDVEMKLNRDHLASSTLKPNAYFEILRTAYVEM